MNWEDSLAIVNNVFITGTSTHFVMRLPANTSTTCDSTNIGRQIRFGGNYIVSNKSSTPTTLVTGAGITTIPGLATSIANNEPDWVDHANYVVSGWSGFDPLSDTSDTLRFGGTTSLGSVQYGNTTASIGPKLYTVAPQISSYYTNSEYYGWTTPREYFQDLIETGILASGWTVEFQMQTVADRIYAEQWFGTDIHAGHLDSLVVQLSDTRRTYTDYSTSFYGYPGPREYFVAEIETGNEGVGTVLDFKVDSEYWRVLADQWFGTDLNAGHLDSLVVRLIN